MKLYKISFALLLGIGTLTSCSDKLELSNPNQPTTETFGSSIKDLEDAVIACYHHTRMEGTYARVGYTLDACRGDEKGKKLDRKALRVISIALGHNREDTAIANYIQNL